MALTERMFIMNIVRVVHLEGRVCQVAGVKTGREHGVFEDSKVGGHLQKHHVRITRVDLGLNQIKRVFDWIFKIIHVEVLGLYVHHSHYIPMGFLLLFDGSANLPREDSVQEILLTEAATHFEELSCLGHHAPLESDVHHFRAHGL